jgi:hypothetical protein
LKFSVKPELALKDEIAYSIFANFDGVATKSHESKQSVRLTFISIITG